tara:strand:- start:233 stop:1009 length:777 start_codon:yes stop_codon:yes gene_type:complete
MALGAIAFLGLLAVVLVGWATWAERRETTIMSQALGEERRLTVYNTDEGNVEQVIIVLDGEKTRHGLSAAVQARTLSWLAGSRSPIGIAVDGMGTRDTDLRNAISNPATWRPRIAGRAADFDRFLAYELLPLARKLAGTPAEIYLFGHSLGGLYSLDFAIRKADETNLAGYAAFSPTFSHDLSIMERLAKLCDTKARGLITIGLESDREEKLFKHASTRFPNAEACAGHAPRMERHPGAIHQIVMLPGQTRAILLLVN